MVAFDAHFLMLALRSALPTSVDRAKERVEKLLTDLQQSGERIVIPTPALCEFLVHAGTAGPQYIDTLQKSLKFKVAPFSVRAAVEVASAIEIAIKKGNKRGGSKDTWAKVNFDRQIAAIAKVEGCHTIYSDDDGLKKFAERLKLKVVTLAELDLPPSKHPLIDKMEELQAQQEKEVANTAPRQTDSAPDSEATAEEPPRDTEHRE